MSLISSVSTPISVQSCHHCGDTSSAAIFFDDKSFCCEGCMHVYQLLQNNGLCNYYDLNKAQSITPKGKYVQQNWAYLDHPDIQQQLLRYQDEHQAIVQLYLPSMHCASCVWLLEQLHKMDAGIDYSSVDFQRKEITITWNPSKTSFRKIVELLSYVGYEPLIRLSGKKESGTKKLQRKEWLKIGIAGFCFGNSMMLSFPEYFSGGDLEDPLLKTVFSWVNLMLSLPVFFFSASGFFRQAWTSLRQKWLHIDAPIALAILITFSRSVYEIVSQTGAGYVDSMSGIVFFMLVGKWFQHKTYDAFSFDRDYTSYFPIGVTRIGENGEENVPVASLKKGDRIFVRNQELIPADSLVCEGKADIDFSYVTGENRLIPKNKGELVYAGGRLSGAAAVFEVVKPVSQSYITQLWNNPVFQSAKKSEPSFVHPWARYFTIAVLVLAVTTGIYWTLVNASHTLSSVTAILIVACPCTLLLASSFTYGNMLRIFGKNRFYLRHAGVIEDMTRAEVIAFDKTGTLTKTISEEATYSGQVLTNHECDLLLTIARQSTHPLSKMIASMSWLKQANVKRVDAFQEVSGKGSVAQIEGNEVRLGTNDFVCKEKNSVDAAHGTGVAFSIEGQWKGRFLFRPVYRQGIRNMLRTLQLTHIVEIISGDRDSERKTLSEIAGNKAGMLFEQSPQDKLKKVADWQKAGKKVMMVGDGLNDAGALQQSDIGIAVSDNDGLFSPSCDAILHSDEVGRLQQFIRYAASAKSTIRLLFFISILYNVCGLWFAVQGILKPVVAAILMPASTISVVFLSALLTTIQAKKWKL